MTQSGQGNVPQPPAQAPREGVVLPAQQESAERRGADRLPAPAPGQPWGQPWGPDAQRAPLPPEMPPGAPLPPAQAPGASEATRYLPPVQDSASANEATRYIPPVGGGPLPDAAAAATQYLPPVPASPQGEATQFLSPQPGGPELPQYLPPVDNGAATQYLPPVQEAGATQYLPPVADEGATQYLPPVSPGPPVPPGPHIPPAGGAAFAQAGERPPPAEFDGLFRESGATEAPQAHRQVPPPRGPQAGPPPQPQPQQPPRRKKLPTPAIVGIVVAACAAAGLGAGALLSGGGDDKSDQQNAASSSSAPGSSPAADDGKKDPEAKADDPALAQAKALDALLKDSNNSRDAVIRAVDATRGCKDLDKSGSDLRDAAKQRDGLVTRLQQTSIDKLPDNAELSAQLTKAWQSSSAADSHYAAWAGQAAGKGGCVKGHAKPTGDSAAGDKASGDATAAKKKAADLWNPIAKKYHLSQHQWTQL
ncbi:hypothetical protein ACH427_05600 [Streptomyces sp. NPDC020379]|uniref:hypothetical protein n=1 Tax=Streptomyces sp. NPDC020379 TaxID=3365071 RepID=UPI0037A5C06B